MPNPNEVLSPEAKKLYDYFNDPISRGEPNPPFAIMKMARETCLTYEEVLEYMMELHQHHFFVYYADLNHEYDFYPEGN